MTLCRGWAKAAVEKNYNPSCSIAKEIVKKKQNR